MSKDKITETVNKPYDQESASPGLDPGDPEAKSGIDQFPRVERKKSKKKEIIILNCISLILLTLLITGFVKYIDKPIKVKQKAKYSNGIGIAVLEYELKYKTYNIKELIFPEELVFWGTILIQNKSPEPIIRSRPRILFKDINGNPFKADNPFEQHPCCGKIEKVLVEIPIPLLPGKSARGYFRGTTLRRSITAFSVGANGINSEWVKIPLILKILFFYPYWPLSLLIVLVISGILRVKAKFPNPWFMPSVLMLVLISSRIVFPVLLGFFEFKIYRNYITINAEFFLYLVFIAICALTLLSVKDSVLTIYRNRKNRTIPFMQQKK